MVSKKKTKENTKKPKKNSEIKAIIFDVGGVLSLSKSPEESHNKETKTKGVHEYIAKKIGFSLDGWFDTIEPFHNKAIKGKISEKEILKKLSERTSVPEKKLRKIIFNAYSKNFKKNKKLYKKAFKIKKKGYKIAILSDQWPIGRRAVMNPKISKKFDVVVVSYEVKLRKPNPEIYDLTLKKLNLKPRECIFIDNHEWNLKPARKKGMKTILFKNNKQLFGQLSKLNINI